MASGPSKDELQMYWQNSRQYFDELANHYRQADPEYYRTHIKPFYDNPFSNIQQNKNRSRGGAKVIAAVAGLLVVMGAAAAIFFLTFKSEIKTETDKLEKKIVSSDEQRVKEIDPVTEKENTGPKTSADEEDTEGMSSEDHFMIGSKKIAEEDYEMAEYHLKKVQPGTQYYKQSKELIQSIKYLKKYKK